MKKQKISDYKDNIITLRKAGMSWKEVQTFLANCNLNVKAVSIRVFWHRHCQNVIL